MDYDKGCGQLNLRPLAMELKQLRYVVQIADSGSISKAAELLRVAQPSLSLQLKSIEEELGVRLPAGDGGRRAQGDTAGQPDALWTLSVVLSRRTANAHCSQAVAKLMAETMRSMVESRQWEAKLDF